VIDGGSTFNSNVWTMGAVPIFFGVGLSVMVQFKAEEDTAHVTFRAAGAEFIV
jgi:hypothetical protein